MHVDSRTYISTLARIEPSASTGVGTGGRGREVGAETAGERQGLEGSMWQAARWRASKNGRPMLWWVTHWWWSGAGVCFLAVVVATVVWGFWAGPLTADVSVVAFLVAGAAGVLAAIAGGIGANRRIARARRIVEDLVRLTRAARNPAESDYQYDNPHLATCWEVLGCDNGECIVFGRRNVRCWQIQQALGPGHPRPCAQRRELASCRRCRVYKASRPDEASEVAEELNNMLFLVRREAEREKVIQEQMAESEKMAAIGQMAAGVAHEVGNPLASISALVQLLRRRTEDHAMREKLDLVQNHIDRISRIVQQVSNFSRRSPRHREVFALGKVIEDAVKLARFDRRSRGIRVVRDDALPELRVHGIREELLQVFLNITYNAFDAMGEEGCLTVATTVDVDCLSVSFSDTGCGVSADALPHVFEPFYTTKEAGKGTGLGLAVSARIIHEHGGRIVIESNQACGTTVHVRLPVEMARQRAVAHRYASGASA